MKPFSFLREVKAELSNVIWPSRRATIELTVLVIVLSILVGIYVGGLDFIFASLLDKFLGAK